MSKLTPQQIASVFGAADNKFETTEGWVKDYVAAQSANGIFGLTEAEVDQLENIGTTTISAGQWGYLGGMNQGVATTDSPSFARANLTLGTNNIPLNISNSGIDARTMIQVVDTQHDNIEWAWDAYWDGANWKSSTGTTNFQLKKNLGELIFRGDSEVVADSNITWNDILKINLNFNSVALNAGTSVNEIVSSISSSSTHDQLATALAVYNAILAGDQVSAPSGPTDTGIAGQWAYGSGYMYRCYTTNTWVRWVVATTW